MCFTVEEHLYAKLWDQDRSAKCAREEMESALQIERNREMLKVRIFLSVLVNVIRLLHLLMSTLTYCISPNFRCIGFM